MEGLTHRFLKGLVESMEALNREANPVVFNPTVALVSALILTGVAAFSHTLKLPLLIFFLSLILISLTHSPKVPWIKLQLFTLLWTIIIAIPLLFTTIGEPLVSLSLGFVFLSISGEGLNTMMTFVARVLAATAIFTSITSIISWRGVIRGLEGLKSPRDVIFLLNTSIVYIPLFLREVLRMISAREGRLLVKPSLKGMWKLMATVVGDLILRGYERAWRLDKAIKARDLNADKGSPKIRVKVRVNDILLLSFALITLILKLKVTMGL